MIASVGLCQTNLFNIGVSLVSFDVFDSYISSLTQASCPYSSKVRSMILLAHVPFSILLSFSSSYGETTCLDLYQVLFLWYVLQHGWHNILRPTNVYLNCISFLQLVNLRTLYLDKCQLSGDIYDKVEKLRRLQHLDLSFNKLRGKIPHGMGGISSLLDLRLSHNHFSGAFPISLASLPHLQTLLLDNNALGGSLPTNVGKMPSLVTLRIHENDFMGRLPDFTDAVYLEEAHFDENYFLGNIPTFGSNRLRSLYLGRNEFTGSLPESIGRISKLEDLYVQRNKLNGTIPSSISKLTALENIDLSFNKLSGSIPDAISGLMQLRELVLNDNRLTGVLPDIGKMKRLEIARLNNNLLSGNLELSLSVGSLNYLTEFAIQNNDLKGVVPEFVCDLLLDVLASDCWGKSSPVDCPCCTQCF